MGAPQARIASLARGLADAGHAVTVHTCFPHYPDGRIKPPYRNAPLSREALGQVRVVRSAVYAARNAGFARRLANHASFAASAMLTAGFAGPADVVVAETPPLFTAAAGVAYARLKRAALVVNVADRWPASAVELGMLTDRRVIRAAEWLERSCYRAAAAVTTPTAGLVEALDAVPEARGKAVRLGPLVDIERFRVEPRSASDGPARVLYAGTIGLAQNVVTLVEAARLAGGEAVEVVIAGDGVEAPAVRDAIGRGGVASVQMLGVVPHADVPGLYADADAAVILLRDRPIFHAALPTKMFEAMAAGRPIVLSARGEAAGVVREARAGIVVPPEDPVALASVLRSLAGRRDELRRLGEVGRRYVETRHSREAVLASWASTLEWAAGAPTR